MTKETLEVLYLYWYISKHFVTKLHIDFTGSIPVLVDVS